MGVRRKQVDGDKFVCLDLILDKDSCIVYSFGVARDWTFEDQMDNIGVILIHRECGDRDYCHNAQ